MYQLYSVVPYRKVRDRRFPFRKGGKLCVPEFYPHLSRTPLTVDRSNFLTHLHENWQNKTEFNSTLCQSKNKILLSIIKLLWLYLCPQNNLQPVLRNRNWRGHPVNRISKIYDHARENACMKFCLITLKNILSLEKLLGFLVCCSTISSTLLTARL